MDCLKNFYFDEIELLAVGILGSMARGDFDKKSDIDIFVIIKDEDWKYNLEDRLRRRLEEVLSRFRRDITLFLYTLSDLKKVLNWYTLSMVRDAVFAYGKDEIKKIFKDILKKAYDVGLVIEKVDGKRIFTKPDIKFGEIIEVVLE